MWFERARLLLSEVLMLPSMMDVGILISWRDVHPQTAPKVGVGVGVVGVVVVVVVVVVVAIYAHINEPAGSQTGHG